MQQALLSQGTVQIVAKEYTIHQFYKIGVLKYVFIKFTFFYYCTSDENITVECNIKPFMKSTVHVLIKEAFNLTLKAGSEVKCGHIHFLLKFYAQSIIARILVMYTTGKISRPPPTPLRYGR